MTEFLLNIPERWAELPAPGDDLDAALDVITAASGATGDPALRLRQGLAGITAYAWSRDNRRNWGFINEPESGRVNALMSLSFRSTVTGDREDYLATAQAIPEIINGVEVINHVVEERAVPAGKAVIIHDFTLDLPDDEGARHSMERAVIGFFPTNWDVLMEFSIVTHEMNLFPDIAGYLLTVVEAIQISEGANS